MCNCEAPQLAGLMAVFVHPIILSPEDLTEAGLSRIVRVCTLWQAGQGFKPGGINTQKGSEPI
ncbi:MAG: hypothetical protein ABSB71_08365 [Candidatus Bathyarchaeia archaeon]